MPVTFRPAEHKANPVTHAKPYTAADMLRSCCQDEYNACEEILQSSFNLGSQNENGPGLLPSNNGLVHTLLTAYNQHHAVVIRPDDVWMAILSQFSFFVNANSEHLRSSFVAHEGKKEIKITYHGGNRYSQIFDTFAKDVIKEMENHLTDRSLREWILPSFSTTTELDTVVASIVMMATMKNFFSYTCVICCGIPQVTLDGEKEDWEKLRRRLEKLKEYNVEGEMLRWHKMLDVILSHFVSSFDDPDGHDNIDFWQKIIFEQNNLSGPDYTCGWINAFSAFNTEGKWLGHSLSDPDATTNVSDSFQSTYRPPSLIMDGAVYHILQTEDIPCGYSEVDVKLIDNGVEFQTKMVAGLVGSAVSSSTDQTLSHNGEDDTVRPQIGWWIYVKRGGKRLPEAQMEKFRKRWPEIPGPKIAVQNGPKVSKVKTKEEERIRAFKRDMSLGKAMRYIRDKLA